MKVEIPGKENIQYEIPDEWWLSARMDSFVLQDDHYKLPEISDAQKILTLDHLKIYPRKRNEGISEFRKESMINLLSRIRHDEPIDPIEIMKPSLDNGYEYWLKNGYHRYRASFAAGFKKIPAILKFNPDIE